MHQEGLLTRIGRQVILYAAASWASRVAGFLMLPLYTRWMGMGEFGAYELLSRGLEMVIAILPMGMTLAFLRSYGLLSGQDRRVLCSTTMVWFIMLGAAAALVMSLFSGPFAVLVLHDGGLAGYARIVGIWAWSELTFSAACSLLRAREEIRTYTAANIGRSVLSVTLGVCLVGWLHMGLNGVLLANALSTGLAAAALAVPILVKVGLSFSGRQFYSMFIFGLPLIGSTVLGAFALTLDRYVLNGYLGVEQVAVFGVGTRISALLSGMVFAPIGLAYYPVIFKTAREPGAPQAYAAFATRTALGVGCVTLALMLFAGEIVAVLAPASYRGAAACGQVYLVGTYLYGLSAQAEIGVYLRGATFWKPIVFGVMAGASLLLNLLLVPRFGAVGAAAAYVGAQLAYTTLLYTVSQRLYRVPYEWGHLTLTLFSLVLCWYLGEATIVCVPLISIPTRLAAAAAPLLVVPPLATALWPLSPHRLDMWGLLRGALRLARPTP